MTGLSAGRSVHVENYIHACLAAPVEEFGQVTEFRLVEAVLAFGHQQTRIHRHPNRVETYLPGSRQIRLGKECVPPLPPERRSFDGTNELRDALLDFTRLLRLTVKQPHVPFWHEPVSKC